MYIIKYGLEIRVAISHIALYYKQLSIDIKCTIIRLRDAKGMV